MDRKYLCMSALAAALMVGSAGLASAQQTTPAPVVDEATAEADDGSDWGWLGLLGLAGLAGLAGARRRQEPVRTTTTGTVR
jgi:MYXO-CTERM domain-containing protein